MSGVTFWYGCNMTRHGEIIRLVTQILEAIGISTHPAGGPGYCCGSPQEANARIAAGMASRTVEKFNESGRETVVTWCPSCHMNMQDLMAPVTPAAFTTQHISELLTAHADQLRPLLRYPVKARALASCASRLPRPRAHQHRNPCSAPPDPRTDDARSSASRSRAHVLSHRAGCRRTLACTPRNHRRYGRSFSRYAGDDFPFLPPRNRLARARSAHSRGELDSPHR